MLTTGRDGQHPTKDAPVTPRPQTARRPRALTRAAAATVTAGALLLGGCAQGPGTAAVIDGRTISETTVQQTRAELDALLPSPIDPRTVVVALMVGPYFVAAAAENGVGVSEGEARRLAEQLAGSSGPQPVEGEPSGQQAPEIGQGTLDVLRFSLASEQLARIPQAAEVIAEVEATVFEAGIDVSPRYGDLDPQTGQLVRPEMPWLGTARP